MRTLSLLVVLLASSVFAQVPATQPFELAQMWQPWTGQVANVCGSGKNCTVQTLTATSTAAAIRLPYGATVGWPATTSATATVSAPSASVLQLAAAGGYVNINGAIRKTAGGGPAAVTIEDADGFTLIGVAYASLPACSGTNAGDIQRDITNNVYRQCVNSYGWMALHRQVSWSNITNIPSAGITLNVPVSKWTLGGIYGTTAKSEANAAGTIAITGAGAGNMVATLWNESDNVTTGVTLTCTCAGAAGADCTAGSVPLLVTNDNKAYGWRRTTACATTNPEVNLSFSLITMSY